MTCRIVDFSQTGQKDSPGKGRTLAPQQRPSRRARVRARLVGQLREKLLGERGKGSGNTGQGNSGLEQYKR